MEYFGRDVSADWLDEDEVVPQEEAREDGVDAVKKGAVAEKQQSARQRIEMYQETRRLERILADDFEL